MAVLAAGLAGDLVGDQLIQYVTLFGALVAAAGVWLAVYVYRRQMNAQLFMAYTQRYEKIMESFPHDARSCRLDLTGPAPAPSQELTVCVLKYLNLCSEEYYLWRNRYLSTGIWNIWKGELERTLQSPLLMREWKKLDIEFDAFGDFSRYVQEIQSANK